MDKRPVGEREALRTFRSLLVTGGAGFIGSHFIRHVLTKTDYEGRIVNLDKLTYAGNPDNLSDVQETFGQRYQLVQGDIGDRALVDRLLAEHGVDAVVHFAAESHVDRSIAGPSDFVQTNVIGTYTLLEAVRSACGKGQAIHFHHVSTDEVFGTLGPEGLFTESTPYDPHSPYSATKAASDHLVSAWSHTYGLSTTLSHCGNNYGPRQHSEKLIPLTLQCLASGRPVPVYGDGQNIRDWLYVEDHAEALWLVLTQGSLGESYNIGGHGERTNLEIVQALCHIAARLTEKPPEDFLKLITFVPDRPGHDRRYAIDPAKMEKELGWKPRHTLEEGLETTVKWYLEKKGRRASDGNEVGEGTQE